VVSLDPRSSRDRTCPWDLVHGLPLTSFSLELVTGSVAGPASDPAPCLGRTKVEVLRLGTRGTLIPRYQQLLQWLLGDITKPSVIVVALSTNGCR
jgi:hypothetical protein